MSSVEIKRYLTVQGFEVHRTTIQSDIAILVDNGVDVITVRSSPNKYFIGQRVLEPVELKMLVDAVMSSKFITTKISQDLIKKLCKLTSVQLADELNREIYVHRVIKPQNETIYYTVDKIQQAINNKKWLKFTYFEYNQDKKLMHKHNGYNYALFPYTTFWKDDHYYVVGYLTKHDKIGIFRVDRIDNPTICDDSWVLPPPDFDAATYANKVFEMYYGKPKTVELRCANHLMNIIVDKFGEDVPTTLIDNNFFKATVDIHISPRFYGWVFGFIGDIMILEPSEIKEEYTSLMKKALSIKQ